MFTMLAFFILYQIPIIFALNIDTDNAIVYKLPDDGKRKSYFGMSVAIRPRADELLDKDWILQMGAPRSNISGMSVVEPGAVFRCRVNGNCYLHKVDQTGNVQIGKKFNRWNGRSNVWKKLFVERKDGGWVGVAMDIKKYREGEVTTICGHRISYQAQTQPLNLHDDQYLSIGGCYVDFLYEPNSTQLFLPLKNEDRAYYIVTQSQADFDWGQGLAGMSAHLSNDGLLLGAPHVYYMTGTILKYPRNWKQPFVANISGVFRNDVRYDFFAYNGYSVGSGNFFGDGKEWYMFGAPRADGLHGRVYAAQFQEFRGQRTIKIHHSVQRGETYGEYFGASLDVGDINRDGFDDLIVGAPMFSQRFIDQGRAYVFFGSKLGFQLNVILNGVAEQARFGTCVSVAGDIDQDGYKDVIIGAPNQNGGALFIYRGAANGISQQPSQVIHASDIRKDMKGFGISISRAVDVDQNKYPDILVGAYQSDEAVLLRSRPVIFLTPSITHPKFLDRKQNRFNISVCFAYLATYPPPFISLDALVVLDEELNRARFAVNSSQVWSINDLQTSYNSPVCKNLTVLFDMSLVNGTFNVPVQVSLENILHRKPDKGTPQTVWENQGSIRSLEPLTNDEVSERKITVSVPFAGDCGLDNICHSHLQLSCDFDKAHVLQDDEKDTFLVGYSDILNVLVSVKNLKEAAYYSSLILIADGIPVGDIIPQDSMCAFQNASLQCSLGTLDEGADKSLVFQITTKHWASSASPLIKFMMHVTTSSNETEPDDSFCDLDLSLSSHAEIHLLASPSEATISLTDSSLALVNFSHMYEAEKRGKSPVTGTLTVSIPTTYHGEMIFAALDQDNPQLSIASEVSKEDVFKLTERDYAYSTRGSFDDMFSPSLSFPVERTLFLNCSSKSVQCITYSYHFVSSAPSTMGRDFPILFNISSLESVLENIDVIHFTTNGTAMIEDRFGPKLYSSKETSTSIIMVPPPAEVEMRAIALSAVAGGLLLALIIPILIREGFFRRKTKEQMEALKVLDFINERFSMYESQQEQDRSSTISVATVND